MPEATANGVEFRFVVTVAANIVSENMKGVVGVVVVNVADAALRCSRCIEIVEAEGGDCGAYCDAVSKVTKANGAVDIILKDCVREEKGR